MCFFEVSLTAALPWTFRDQSPCKCAVTNHPSLKKIQIYIPGQSWAKTVILSSVQYYLKKKVRIVEINCVGERIRNLSKCAGTFQAKGLTKPPWSEEKVCDKEEDDGSCKNISKNVYPKDLQRIKKGVELWVSTNPYFLSVFIRHKTNVVPPLTPTTLAAAQSQHLPKSRLIDHLHHYPVLWLGYHYSCCRFRQCFQPTSPI